jgi:hypothetical protein
MCWSASVSLNTYIFSVFACIFAYMNGVLSIVNMMFIQSYCIMQLIEYFIWSKTFSNRLLSQIAWIIIYLQPIFSMLTIASPYQYVIPYAIVAYCVIMAYIFIYVYPWNTIQFESKKASNGHLAWYWLNSPFWVCCIWIFFLMISFILNKTYLIAFVVLATLMASYILYKGTLTWGSMWCWVANYISIYLIYLVFAKEICK